MKKLKNRYCFLSCFGIFVFSQISAQGSFTTDTVKTDSSFCLVENYNLYSNNFLLESYRYYRCYYLDGALKELYSKNLDGEYGLHFRYFPNGKIRCCYNSIMNRRVGIFVEWYDNGRIKSTGSYKNINCIGDIRVVCDTIYSADAYGTGYYILCNTESIKEGIWVDYDYLGKLIGKKEW